MGSLAYGAIEFPMWLPIGNGMAILKSDKYTQSGQLYRKSSGFRSSFRSHYFITLVPFLLFNASKVRTTIESHY